MKPFGAFYLIAAFLAIVSFGTPTFAQSDNKYNVEIFIHAHNRLPNLKQLWASLVEADYLGKRISLTLTQKVTVSTEVQNWIDTLQWPHGHMRIHKRKIKVLARTDLEETWYPLEPNSFGVFFDEDTVASPFWFFWLNNAINEYYYKAGQPPKLAGFSLFRPKINELTNASIAWGTSGRPQIFQQPQTLAQVLVPRAWRYFRNWMGLHNCLLLLPLTREEDRGAEVREWKESITQMFYEEGLYFIYPNFYNDMSLATYIGDGSNDPYLKHAKNVPLLTVDQVTEWRNDGKHPFVTPSLEDLQVIDIVGQTVSNTKALPNGANKLPIGYLFVKERDAADADIYDKAIVTRPKEGNLDKSKILSLLRS